MPRTVRGIERDQMTKYEKEQIAFDYMLELIQQGVEYPEAQWKAAQRFQVSMDTLQAMYDGEN